MAYKWAHQTGKSYGDSTEIYEHLEHLRSQEELTLDLLIKDASKRSSPLHRLIEWDNATAATAYRRSQLTRIMGRLVKVNGKGEMSRVYIPIRDPNGDEPRYYDQAARVLRMPQYRKAYARRGLMEIARLQVKYADFPEIRNVLRAMNQALKPVIRPALARLGAD